MVGQTTTGEATNRRIRVLFPFVGDRVGGSYLSSLALVRGMTRSRIEPLVAVSREGPLTELLRSSGVDFVPFDLPVSPRLRPPWKGLVRCSVLAPKLAAFLRRHQVDIVQTNDVRMHYLWPLATRLARRRQVVRFTSWVAQDRGILLELMRLVDAIVCNSGAVQEELKPVLRRRSRVLHSPIDWARNPPNRLDSRNRIIKLLGCKPDCTIIGFFANLTERKRVLIFVEAAMRIVRARPGEYVFLVYGEDREGYEEKALKMARQAGVDGLFRFMGFAREVESLMAGCDALMAPAVREPMGLTLLEACFVGTPLVAAADAGHKEIYGSVLPNFLCPPDDPDAFATKMLDILRGLPAARRKLAAARPYLAREFSIPAIVNELSNIYLDLMGRGGGDG